MLLVGEGVAGGGVLEANASHDVAGGAAVTVDAVVGVHLEDAAQALTVVLVDVVHVAAGIGVAGVHAEVGELTDVGVGHDLESQGAEGLLGVGVTHDGLAVLGIGALDGGDVERAGEVIHNRVEDLLNTLVLVGGAHEDRVELAGKGALADGGLEHLDGDLLLHEDGLHQLVREVGGGIKQLVALLVGKVDELGGNLFEDLRVNHALGVLLEVPRLHGHEVDEAPELGLGTHGDLAGNRGGAQAILHGLDGMEEVRTDAVELVDERDTRDVVVGSLTPDGLGLRLNAGDGVKDG